MPLIKPTTEIPALRLLLQSSDDFAAADLAVASARMLAGSKPVVIVNGAPADVACLARRHDVLLMVGADGLPVRTVGAIADELDQLEPGSIGAIVITNVAGIARATRCSTRVIDDIKALGPGHWDDFNEALWAMQERLNRLGVHAIYCAPSTPDRGLSDDGEEIILNTTSPQGWKDLARSVHTWIEVSTRSGRAEAVVRRDDTGRLGPTISPTPEGIVGPLLELARSAKAGPASSTLHESASAELAARERLDSRAVARSSAARERLTQLATLRVLQGPESWSEHLAEAAEATKSMASHDAAAVDTDISKTAAAFDGLRRWHATALRFIDESPLNASLDSTLRPIGPAPELCPEHRRDDHDAIIGRIGPDTDRQTIIAAIRGMAEDCNLWTRWQFAGVCATAGFTCYTPAWSAYSDASLAHLAATLSMLDQARRTFDAPTAKAEPRLVEPEPTDDDDAESRVLFLIGEGAAADKDPVVDVPGASASIPIPALADFEASDRRDQLVYLSAALSSLGAFERWEEIRRSDPRIGSCRKSERWGDEERLALYSWALAALSGRRAA